MIKSGQLVVSSVLLFAFKDEIKPIIQGLCNYCSDLLFSQITINIQDNPKCIFSIKEELIQTKMSRVVARDGVGKPQFTIADGNYIISHLGKYINVCFDYENKSVTLTVFWKPLNFIKQYLTGIYKKHCASENVIVFYGINDNKWSFPIFRRPRSLENIEQTSDMKTILDDVQLFDIAENIYSSNGLPYKKGYLLEGPPGVGKTTTIEIIAMKHNRSGYIVNLNAKDMTDSVLINLVSTVPPRSIIIFEEIEKQIKTLESNDNKMVSYGGILSALDGPQRLSHGTIVILTANNIDSLEKSFTSALLRPGRIDKHYKLTRRI